MHRSRMLLTLLAVALSLGIANDSFAQFKTKAQQNACNQFAGGLGMPTGNVSSTTVQLPVFANTSVQTTVSVPDGGTVLLGGIKRLAEGRTERGVPMLSKLPYISRLFKNVGIGRETNSLMMMVTPRIIIQEEEE